MKPSSGLAPPLGPFPTQLSARVEVHMGVRVLQENTKDCCRRGNGPPKEKTYFRSKDCRPKYAEVRDVGTPHLS